MAMNQTRRTMIGVGLLMVFSAAIVSSAQEEHFWHQWRGPLMTGVAPSADPPSEWNEDNNVRWKVEIPGKGLGTPIVWDDRVFILTAIPVGPDNASALETDHEFVTLAIRREDGSLLWRQTARSGRPHQGKRDNASFASASAITDGEHVIAFFGSRGLYCYDMEGNLQWEKDLGDMNIRNSFGEGATPALYEHTVVITWDHQGPSFIVALDKGTGEELWRQDRDEIDTWATPLVVAHEGRHQVITSGTHRVRSYDLASGRVVWEDDGLTMNPIPSPVFADGVVYLMSGYRGNAMRAIRLADAPGLVTGREAVLWEYNQDTPYVPSPLLYGENLYFIKSNSALLTNLNVNTGEVNYGPLRLERLEEVYASPVGAAGRVYLLGREGNALVIEDGPEFKIIARNSLDDGFDASPAIAGREIYLRGYRYLYRVSTD